MFSTTLTPSLSLRFSSSTAMRWSACCWSIKRPMRWNTFTFSSVVTRRLKAGLSVAVLVILAVAFGDAIGAEPVNMQCVVAHFKTHDLGDGGADVLDAGIAELHHL